MLLDIPTVVETGYGDRYDREETTTRLITSDTVRPVDVKRIIKGPPPIDVHALLDEVGQLRSAFIIAYASTSAMLFLFGVASMTAYLAGIDGSAGTLLWSALLILVSLVVPTAVYQLSRGAGKRYRKSYLRVVKGSIGFDRSNTELHVTTLRSALNKKGIRDETFLRPIRIREGRQTRYILTAGDRVIHALIMSNYFTDEEVRRINSALPTLDGDQKERAVAALSARAEAIAELIAPPKPLEVVVYTPSSTPDDTPSIEDTVAALDEHTSTLKGIGQM